MNIELLQKIAGLIVAHPRNFTMDNWRDFETGLPRMCIAGWAAMLSAAPDLTDIDAALTGAWRASAAANILLMGLTIDTAARLCLLHNWPRVYSMSYEWTVAQRDAPAAARIAAERIRHFISTDGAE